MVEALIYMADMGFEDEINDFFDTNIFNVTIVYDIDDAVKKCSGEWFDLIFIFPAEHEKTRDFLATLEEERLNYLPCIALLNSKDELREIAALPIVDYILLPAPREEFCTIINRILEDLDLPSTVLEGMNWQGSLEEYNLLDLIQLVDESQKDAQLTFSYLENSATLYFKNGKLVHASHANLYGEAVLHKLVFWTKGNFRIQFSEISVNRTINSSNQEIVLTVAYDLSEWDRAYRGLPDLYEEIIAIPFTESVEISSFQKDIVERCKYPVAIFDLFLNLVEDNKMIILELKTILQNGLIGTVKEIEQLLENESRQKGMAKIIDSFSSVFKKKQELDEIQVRDEPFRNIDPITRIEFKHIDLDADDKEKILKKIDTLN